MTSPSPAPQPSRTTFGEMLGELLDVGGGLVVVLLPFAVLYVPGIILFVVLPAILLAAIAIPLTVVALPPFLLVRRLRRRAPAYS